MLRHKLFFSNSLRFIKMDFHKPPKPNLLIWSTNSSEFGRIKLLLQDLLGKMSYTIYQLDSPQTTSTVWKSNCVALVTSESQQSTPGDILSDYLKQGGRILSLSSINRESQLEFESNYLLDNSIKTVQVNEIAKKYTHTDSLGVHLVLKVNFEMSTLDENLNEKISSILYDELGLKRIDDDEARMRDKFFEKYHLITRNQVNN